jgi:hypothetical protein
MPQYSVHSDKLRGFGAKHMLPSHGRPLSGKQNIEELLTSHRDAIQSTPLPYAAELATTNVLLLPISCWFPQAKEYDYR